MIGAKEIVRESDPTQFQLRVLDSTELGTKKKVGASDAINAIAPFEIAITGSQLLIGSVSALCAVALMVWAFLKLWLFE
jgi:hypothetical protein